MKIKDLIVKARTYRRFQENKPVDTQLLVDIIDAVRQVPSAANLLPLRYAISTSPEYNARIFPCLRFAAKFKDWPGPDVGERPTAYIVIGGDMANARKHQVDMGIAAQSIQLALAEEGVGCCMVANMNPKNIAEIVGFPDTIEVLLVLAIGYPGETVVLDTVKDGNTDYWRDEKSVHHVPKHALAYVLLATFR